MEFALTSVAQAPGDELLITGDRIGERAIIACLRGVELRRHAIIPLEMPGRA